MQTAADAETWIALMKQNVNPVELTAEFLNTLIEKKPSMKLSRARTEAVSRRNNYIVTAFDLWKPRRIKMPTGIAERIK